MIEIAVTNQKTKSIRPACRLAGLGSHGMTSATTVAPAPTTIPMATSWATDPLRTDAETTRRRARTPKEAPRAQARSKRLQRAMFSTIAKMGTSGAYEKEVRWDSESAFCLSRPARFSRGP